MYTREGDLCNSVNGISIRSSCQLNIDTAGSFRLLRESKSILSSDLVLILVLKFCLLQPACGAKECFSLYTKPLLISATDFV